jgi:hypothetical protein
MVVPRPGPLAVALVLVAALASCSVTGSPADTGSETDAGAGHVHDRAGARVSLPVGDGTKVYEVGYTLRDVRVPGRAGKPGRLRFTVENYHGRPQTGFLPEQTKRMHVYVVRADLAVFRHVHPELKSDGSWVANLTLPEPGDYRVVVEFVARDEGGDGDHVLLGKEVTVPGDWKAQPLPDDADVASDWAVRAEVLTDLRAGTGEELRIRLATPEGETPQLGQFLGTFAHLTGFHARTGAAVHMHPLGAPEIDADGTQLVFHAELPEPGEYVLFLQVPVDGFLHTLRLPVAAT